MNHSKKMTAKEALCFYIKRIPYDIEYNSSYENKAIKKLEECHLITN